MVYYEVKELVLKGRFNDASNTIGAGVLNFQSNMNPKSKDQNKIYKEFDNLLVESVKKLYESGLPSEPEIDPESEKERLSKGEILFTPILQKLDKIEKKILNFDRWLYNDDQLERFKELVNSALTRNPFYIRQLSKLFRAVEDEHSPVLIFGETGVGKNKLAEKFHQLSSRSNIKKGLVSIDCGSLDRNSIYPNLFGAIKGSFTDAKQELPGKIKEADGGTLFIDEIDKAPQEVRYRLLTFLDTNKYQPLGSKKDIKADVCLLIGTNQNPETLVSKGLIEEDFFFRIVGRMIHIPPLRNRKDDIPIISEYIVDEFNKKYKTEINAVEATEDLTEFQWPGSVSPKWH